LNTTVRIAATGLATMIVSLGLGGGLAAAHYGPPAGTTLAIPCDKNPSPSDPDPDPIDGPTEIVRPQPTPYPDPDPAGPTGVAPIPDPEINPDLRSGPVDLGVELWPTDPEPAYPRPADTELPDAEPVGPQPADPDVAVGAHIASPRPDDDCGQPHGGGGGSNEEGRADEPTVSGGGTVAQPPSAGGETLAYTGYGAGMVTAAAITLIGAGAFALLLVRMVHRRTLRS
jgi:hypothetical protein